MISSFSNIKFGILQIINQEFFFVINNLLWGHGGSPCLQDIIYSISTLTLLI